MNNLSEIKKSIKKIVADNGFANSFTAKVESVDGEICSVSIDGFTLNDVRLRAVINDETSKILITPTIGSYVLVTDLIRGNLTSLAVIAYSEIDKIDIDADNTIIINGGENNGLVKVEPLTKKLIALEKDLNALKQIFAATWVPVVYDGGASLKAAAATWAGQMFQPVTQQSDIENDKVKH
ncbi:MAG: hypothetical protein PHR20_02215 [Bacteroidales bacterium]|nr:hypothetical protein [Bacteroidales bacterium]